MPSRRPRQQPAANARGARVGACVERGAPRGAQAAWRARGPAHCATLATRWGFAKKGVPL
eukprot:5107146-Lingulodinium_polyedra.AAC.1